MLRGRYIYHYHAQHQRSGNGVTHMSGIAQMECRIVDMERYREFKELIEPGEDSKDTIITSLSYLGREF